MWSFRVSIILTVLLLNFYSQVNAHGIHKASIDPGYNSRIIDDILFVDSNSMSENAIQNFLQQKVPTCREGYICLKDYVDPSVNKKASRIIWEEATRVGLNPQVILATLQKEQSLVTDDFPYDSQYREAMGYGCLESQSTCDSQYYGFYNQVRLGSTVLRVGYDRNCGNSSSFPGWSTNIKWKRNNTVAVDGKNTYMENCSVGSLYSYTPHRPDSAYLTAADGSHYYGNYNFIFFFRSWFRPTWIDDTLYPHPDGTLISLGGRAYLIYNGQRRWITTASIFESYFYRWSEVKPATTGDYGLPEGPPVDVIRPGTLFRTPSSSVYTMEWNTATYTWQKQLVTYSAFIGLGFLWEDVHIIPENEMPTQTYPQNLTPDFHPHGTLIRTQGDERVYMIEHNTRRHLPYPEALYSYNLWWNDIRTATAQDSNIPIGPFFPYREGTILYDGSNLFIVDIPPTGDPIKRPIGPWSCFSEKLKYQLKDAYSVPASQLPTETGPLITC